MAFVKKIETKILLKDDPLYPKRVLEVMGDKAPKRLFVRGNLNLLQYKGLGFCGSRKSSVKGLETAKDCAEQAAFARIVIVSGNAAGVDFEAHYSALKSGGNTIFVLPEGINHFRIKKSFEDIWDWERVLVVSQFEPEDTWKSFRAMTRNLLIIALSRAMIVIEAGEKGGTLHSGQETLKFGLPLYVAEYQDMTQDAKGNKILLDKGAKRLARSKATSRANMDRIFDEIQRDIHNTLIKQGSFF